MGCLRSAPGVVMRLMAREAAETISPSALSMSASRTGPATEAGTHETDGLDDVATQAHDGIEERTGCANTGYDVEAMVDPPDLGKRSRLSRTSIKGSRATKAWLSK